MPKSKLNCFLSLSVALVFGSIVLLEALPAPHAYAASKPDPNCHPNLGLEAGLQGNRYSSRCKSPGYDFRDGIDLGRKLYEIREVRERQVDKLQKMQRRMDQDENELRREEAGSRRYKDLEDRLRRERDEYRREHDKLRRIVSDVQNMKRRVDNFRSRHRNWKGN